MCGIAGFLQNEAFHVADVVSLLHRMADTLVSRGPDDSGVWYDPEVGIGLAHRRLCVLDLSSAGHQPMVSASGRYVIVFNGEIYNHLELRAEMGKPRSSPAPLPGRQDGQQWRGHSDTETLLAGFDAWGIRKTVERAIGMFAFAVWDRETRVLTLGRDRMGEKPLYYGWQGNVFLFGSELKALRAHPAFAAEINRDALSLLMRHSYIPAPHSIYQGIHKLLPGCLLQVSSRERQSKVERYWSFLDVVLAGAAQPLQGSPEEITDELEALLKSAVRQQMIADVPLGAFLSGGIDSSTVVALMQAQSDQPVKTFTIGFKEEGYNEAPYAKAVAQHLGTDHTELYVTPEQALEVIPRLPTLYCEPFSDPSQIPTFLVSQLARQHVTVSLSGDAGDEMFGGYSRYFRANNLWRRISRLPCSIRRLTSAGIRALSPSVWNALLGPVQPLMPRSLHRADLGDRLHKGAHLLSRHSLEEFYLGFVTHWDPAAVVLGGKEPATPLNGASPDLSGLYPVERMMALDAITYLPDDILVKVDRAAMGVSLETRMPFLDHRVVEFAWRLPLSLKIRNGQGKWLLRQVLYRYVPKELIERPKMGFAVPIDAWLRGPLREWAEALLAEDRLKREGFFDPQPIRQKWAEHLSGKRNWQNHLWDVLMFQAWLEKWR